MFLAAIKPASKGIFRAVAGISGNTEGFLQYSIKKDRTMPITISASVRGRIYIATLFIVPLIDYLAGIGMLDEPGAKMLYAWVSVALMLARVNLTPAKKE